MSRPVPLLLIALGCVADEKPVPLPEHVTQIGAARHCESPSAGIALEEEGPSRGLDAPNPSLETERAIPGVVAEDLDGDEDIDVALLFSSEVEHIRLHWNDGTGRFTTAVEPSWAPLLTQPPISRALAAADLDGDRLPELILVRPGQLRVAANLGSGRFGAFEPVFVHDADPPWAWTSLAMGDVDGDADLDVLVTTTFASAFISGLPHGEDNVVLAPAAPDLLLRNDAGDYTLVAELEPYGRPNYAQIASFTDRDRDGDLDLFLPSEFGGFDGADPTAFYRNDGADPAGWLALVNDAEAMQIALDVGGMGLDSTDFDGDGRLDYCVVQVGPTRCVLSSGGGAYVEAGASLGLSEGPRPDWSGYSFELADFDNDGHLDAVAAGGASGGGPTEHEDRLWVGQGDGTFVDRGAELGFSDADHHFGLATADFDADGALDVVLSALGEAAPLWMGGCTEHSWVEVSLDGPGLNRQGFGAQVDVVAGGRTTVREMQHLRAVGQGPARLHFGLGDAESVDRITVRWPGGATTTVESLPARQHYRIRQE